MFYCEYDPHFLLSSYIDKFWIAHGRVDSAFSLKVLPDACIDVIFAYSDSATDRGMIESEPYLIGSYTSWSEECFSGMADMLGVRFKPAGIGAFVRDSLRELANGKVELGLLDTVFDRKFYLSLQDQTSPQHRMNVVQNYLIGRLPYSFGADQRIEYALNIIDSRNGCMPVAEVASKVCLSQRQFERVFKDAMSISAKTYSRIVRFNNARDYLNFHPTTTIFEAAMECGYFDHSHMIKDFETLGGQSPLDFVG